MKNLESKLPLSLKPHLVLDIWLLLTLLQLTESNVKLNNLNAMVENAVAFFYPSESSTDGQVP
jgi:hypothetical protein